MAGGWGGGGMLPAVLGTQLPNCPGVNTPEKLYRGGLGQERGEHHTGKGGVRCEIGTH